MNFLLLRFGCDVAVTANDRKFNKNIFWQKLINSGYISVNSSTLSFLSAQSVWNCVFLITDGSTYLGSSDFAQGTAGVSNMRPAISFYAAL